jgi:hypothetical protein
MRISVPVFLVHARNTMNVMTVAVGHKKNVTMISAKHCLIHAMLNMVLVSVGSSAIEWQDYIAIKCARKAKNITGSKATAT